MTIVESAPDVDPVTVNGLTWTGEQPPYATDARRIAVSPRREYLNAIPTDWHDALNFNTVETFTVFATAYRNVLADWVTADDAPEDRTAFASYLLDRLDEHFAAQQERLTQTFPNADATQLRALNTMQLVHGSLEFGPNDTTCATGRELLEQRTGDTATYTGALTILLECQDITARIRGFTWRYSPHGWTQDDLQLPFHNEHQQVWAAGMVMDPQANIAFDVQGEFLDSQTPAPERLRSLIESERIYGAYNWLNNPVVREAQLALGRDGGAVVYLSAYHFEGMQRGMVSIRSHQPNGRLLLPIRAEMTDWTQHSTPMPLPFDRSVLAQRRDIDACLDAWTELLEDHMRLAADDDTSPDVLASMWPAFESASSHLRISRDRGDETSVRQSWLDLMLDAIERTLDASASDRMVLGWGPGAELDVGGDGTINPRDARYAEQTARMLIALEHALGAMNEEYVLTSDHRNRIRAAHDRMDAILDSWGGAFRVVSEGDEPPRGIYRFSEYAHDDVAVTSVCSGMAVAWMLRSERTGAPDAFQLAEGTARVLIEQLSLDTMDATPKLVWSYSMVPNPMTQFSTSMPDDVRLLVAMYQRGMTDNEMVIGALAASLRDTMTSTLDQYTTYIDGPTSGATLMSTLPATAFGEVLRVYPDDVLASRFNATLASMLTAYHEGNLDRRDGQLRLLQLLDLAARQPANSAR
ncbi:MAG: hypothetical protein AAF432_08305 [Planctomycetota bacterium]